MQKKSPQQTHQPTAGIYFLCEAPDPVNIWKNVWMFFIFSFFQQTISSETHDIFYLKTHHLFISSYFQQLLGILLPQTETVPHPWRKEAALNANILLKEGYTP